MCGRELLYKHNGRRNDSRGAATTVVLVCVCAVGAVLGSVWVWHVAGTHFHSVQLAVNTDKLLHLVDREFLSVALDSSSIRNGWVQKHIRSKRLIKLASVLAPAYFRVGGTSADLLQFHPNDPANWMDQLPDLPDGQMCAYAEVGCAPRNMTQFNMSGRDWIGLNEFSQRTGMQLLFDLNVLLREGSRWNDSNARLLLEFSDKRGFDVVWQLGNEPNAFWHVFGMNISASTLGHDFVALRHLLNSFPRYRKAKLIGPDITRPIEKISSNVSPMKYLEEFLEVANRSIDAVAWHQYYVNGRKAKLSDFVKPAILDILEWQISAVQFVMSGVSLPMWLTETASAYGGGAPELSDRFVAGFMWMDKLGLAARLGVSVVVRQSLCGGNYALLDEHLFPLPDWWLSVLYKQLVGRGVLQVSGAPEHVRIYCHCAQEPNAIVLFGMNLATIPSVISVLGVPASSRVLEFVLTCDRILTSKHVLLNNKKLELNPDASLPHFEPVITSLSKPLVIPPFSMAFWVVQDVTVPACVAHD